MANAFRQLNADGKLHHGSGTYHYGDWGSDDEEESKEYWPEISSPADLVKYTGTDVTLYALEDAVYARSKTGNPPYESKKRSCMRYIAA